jgi:hypothetical protein
LYLKNEYITKIKNSICLIPPHSTHSINATYNLLSYINFILNDIKSYKLKIILTEKKKLTNKIIKLLKQNNIKIINSAKINDKNSLKFIKRIFSSVDIVTSPCLGSHIPYAAHCGCKISVCGPRFKYSKKLYENDEWSKHNLEVIEKWIKWENSGEAQKTYPFLFCKIANAKSHVKWADEVLGARYKKTPMQLKRLLGWCKVTNFINKNLLRIKYADD